ncbi:MAG: signal recognition particle-docking protein FtsY [Candidatus Bathyarchaeia archaeon]
MLEKLRERFKAAYEKLSKTELKGEKLEEVLEEFKIGLISSDVAFEVAGKLCEDVKQHVKEVKVPRGADRKKVVREVFHRVLNDAFKEVGSINLEKLIEERVAQRKLTTLLFLGVNGTGKTTTIAKLAYLFKKKGLIVVLACSDTFRAGSIEQLEEHANRLSVKMIKHQYGADAAAVAYDAVNYARAKGANVVMIDTAGRMQTDRNLMDEVEKISRVIKPDLKILVLDALTANDAVQQCRAFNQHVGVDGVVLTKIDADAKGGAALSVIAEIGKPIIYVGTGQGYEDIKPFKPEELISFLVP